MKKILMICYYYPPIIDVGSLRSIAFSKYLPSYGYKPSVLTVYNPDRRYCNVGAESPPDGVMVYRAKSLFNPGSWIELSNAVYARIRKLLGLPPSYNLYVFLMNLFIPDIFGPWIPGAVFKGLQLKKENFQAIYVSCSPLSGGVAGAILKKMFRIPLVLDFRDPMSNRIHERPENPFDRIRQRIEHWLLRSCDHLILVSHETKERYLNTYPFLDGKVSVIHNGFHDAFLSQDETPRKPNSRFTLLYSGNFYHNLVIFEPFFEAVKRLLESEEIKREEFLFRYVGDLNDWVLMLVKEKGLGPVVEVTGHVDREKVKRYLRDADTVLLRNYKPCITTKLYEGLAAGKTFLATIEQGEVENMVKEFSPSSVIVHPGDTEAIRGGLKELYNRWKEKEIRDNVSKKYLEKFNWNSLTKKLSEVLNQARRGLY